MGSGGGSFAFCYALILVMLGLLFIVAPKVSAESSITNNLCFQVYLLGIISRAFARSSKSFTFSIS